MMTCIINIRGAKEPKMIFKFNQDSTDDLTMIFNRKKMINGSFTV